VSRSPRGLNSNPGFGVKGPVDRIISFARCLCDVLCTRGFTWQVLLWNLLFFACDPPCPRVSRGVLWLHCFFYLIRFCGTCFFNLAVVVMGSKWSSSLESTRPPDESS